MRYYSLITSMSFGKLQTMINNFKNRIISDFAIFESESCLSSTLVNLDHIAALDKASLVITPNSVKAGKLFSIIPTDGSGDMAAVRATTATLVNSEGLIEDCPYNLLSYSEQFDNAYWTKTNSIIITNYETSPMGTMDASKLVETTSNSTHRIESGIVTAVTSNIYSASFYCKANERDWCVISYEGIPRAYFNLSTGQIGSTNLIISANIFQLDNGWYRCSITYTATDTTTRAYIGIAIDNDNASYTGDGTSGIYIWGAQLVTGTEPKEYFPTTDRLNVPRLDYSNGSCPSILVEPQRTNLVLRSNELSTAPNVLDSVTGTSNFYVSPDGSINAIKLAEKTVNDRHGFYQYFNVTAQTYTVSIFTKQIGRRYICLMSDFTGTNRFSFFDLQEKVVVSNGTGFTCSIEEYSDGWFRLSATVTASAGSRYIIFGGSTNGTTNTYIGNTSTFITFYGFQLEVGSNATSYIPTVASAVTRNADVISKTGISSLIGQTEGTLFAHINFKQSNEARRILALSDGTTNNRIVIAVESNNSFRALVVSSGNISTVIDTASSRPNGIYKLAFKYKQNEFNFYVNGQLIGNDNLGDVPLTSQFFLGKFETSNVSTFFNGEINSVALWKTQLTDEQCINLTTI